MAAASIDLVGAQEELDAANGYLGKLREGKWADLANHDPEARADALAERMARRDADCARLNQALAVDSLEVVPAQAGTEVAVVACVDIDKDKLSAPVFSAEDGPKHLIAQPTSDSE